MRLLTIVTASILGLTAAIAQTGPADKPDSGSLNSKSDEMAPEAGAGSTANPTAQPKSGSLQDKGKQATDGGSNPATNPTGKPASSDLSSKKTNE